jgi:hypothetical protein
MQRSANSAFLEKYTLRLKPIIASGSEALSANQMSFSSGFFTIQPANFGECG